MSPSDPAVPPAPSAPYTPGAVLNAFCANLAAPEESRVLTVRGIYRPNPRGTSYGGWYYDDLLEEHGDTNLRLKIPADLRALLEPGRIYLLQGSLSKQPRRSSIEITLVVSDVLERQAPRFTEGDARRARVVTRKAEAGRRDVTVLLRRLLHEGSRPRVALVLGRTAITLEDVTSAMGESAPRYDLLEERVSLARPDAIADALRRAEADVVGVVRGGGGGLEVFDDPALAEAALELEAPLVSAIGHAEDRTLFEQVADRAFPTPTALGAYLREVAEAVFVENERARLVRDLQEQVRLQQEERERLLVAMRRRNAGLVAAMALLGALVLVLILVATG